MPTTTSLRHCMAHLGKGKQRRSRKRTKVACPSLCWFIVEPPEHPAHGAAKGAAAQIHVAAGAIQVQRIVGKPTQRERAQLSSAHYAGRCL